MELRASIEVWKRLVTSPSEEKFVEELEKPYANMTTAVIWLFAAGLITTLIWLLIFLLLDPMSQSLAVAEEFWLNFGLSQAEVTEMVTQMEETADFTMFSMLCGFLFGIPLMAVLWSAILWGIARLLGANGSFEKQTFLIAAIITPLTIVSALVYMIPFIGMILIIAFNFYILYLTYFAMKAVHGLSSGKVATVVLTPFIALFTVGCCASVMWLALLSAAMGMAA